MDRLGITSHEVARGQWIQIALESHHGVPRAISSFLGIPSDKWDDAPAFLTTMLDHRVGLDSLHGAMRARGIDLSNIGANFGGTDGPARLVKALMDAYDHAGIPDFGSQCKQFLVQFGY